MDIYDTRGEHFGNIDDVISGTNATTVDVVLHGVREVSETCVVGDQKVIVRVSDSEPFGLSGQNDFLYCLVLESTLVEEIESASDKLKAAELTSVEANRHAALERMRRGEISYIISERNETLWKERDKIFKQRQDAIKRFVSEVLRAKAEPALAKEYKVAHSNDGMLSTSTYLTEVACDIPKNISQRFALVVTSGKLKLKSASTYIETIETVGKGGTPLAKTAKSEPTKAIRLKVALPSTNDLIDRVSVDRFTPKAADVGKEAPITIWGTGFAQGLRCSYGIDSFPPGGEVLRYAEVLNESCAICTIPKLNSTSSHLYTSIDLFYKSLCRNTINVHRYKTPEIVGIHVVEALRYGRTLVWVLLDKPSMNMMTRWPEKFMPSCQLKSRDDTSLSPMEVEIFESNSSLLCSTSNRNIVEGTYNIGFSLNSMQFTYSQQSLVIRGSEISLEDVKFGNSSAYLMVTLFLHRNGFADDVSAVLRLKLYPFENGDPHVEQTQHVGWEKEENGPKTFLLRLEEDMMPRISSRLELSIAESKVATFNENSAKVLWEPEIAQKFLVKEGQHVLHYDESKYARLEITPQHYFQFQDALIHLRAKGGNAIPNYHYRASSASFNIKTGCRFCNGVNDLDLIKDFDLQVEILWQNIKPEDFLTIDLELKYEQNNEEVITIYPSALQLWGLRTNSCPTGFSRLGLRSDDDFIDLGFNFELYEEVDRLSRALILDPPYNPTVASYSTVTFASSLNLRAKISNNEKIERLQLLQSKGNQVLVSSGSNSTISKYQIPLRLDHGDNQVNLELTTSSGQKASYQVDIYRYDPSEYMRYLAILRGNESKIVCGHESVPSTPYCIPGSHYFQQLNASTSWEKIILQVDSDTKIKSSSLPIEKLPTGAVGFNHYVVSEFSMDGHTFDIAYNSNLGVNQNLTLTIDFSERVSGGLQEQIILASEKDVQIHLQEAFPSCEVCPKGFFSNAINSTYCRPCSAGHFSSDPGGRMCIPCNPGYYSLKYGNSECLPCLRGLYMPLFGGKECLECPSNATTVEIGSNSCILVVEEQSNKILPSIIVEFTVTLNATELSGIGLKLGVHNISDEHAIGILMKDDTAEGFSTPEYKVKPTDIHVSVLEFEVDLVLAKINVTMVPNITVRASEKEVSKAIKQLRDISADKGINLLADNPDQFFGRTLEAVNGTSQVDHIMQRQTPHWKGSGGGVLPVYWIISLSIFTAFSSVCGIPKIRRKFEKCTKCKTRRRKRRGSQNKPEGNTVTNNV